MESVAYCFSRFSSLTLYTEVTECSSTEDKTLPSRTMGNYPIGQFTDFIRPNKTLEPRIAILQMKGSVLKYRLLHTWILNTLSAPQCRPLAEKHQNVQSNIAVTRQYTPPACKTFAVEIENNR